MFKTDVPDYIRDQSKARRLAKKIQRYWHNLGYTNVKVFTVEERDANGTKNYYIRSNISFTVPSLQT